MKLLIIITQKEDSKKLEQALISQKFQLTRFESFGGFLQKKNATYIIGIEDEKVSNVLDLIKKSCKSKEEVVTPPVAQTFGLGEVVPQAGATKIVVGGAIVFVLPCEKVVKF
ncbi:MAG: cyclic-di-AMP receptor [Patescibacteria group bacterium]